ncbi:endolytic transglycosylase MltG [Streptomyces sp. ISL-11]|uniref:endolytic transglycosylase MltG n=1 Tax=Streptomyces sp. ISL-11 TaxID=2819174 RepID=UPI001BEBDC4F|nr:endolytic transglycosylase MltG [Streptomyces sp. ISL-11]MBT2385984.1 endolytic transglycosylase MltG [Streptomyces sp. ISL-11]
MTEYGRGPGSQPWHPEDPLYGDRGYDGHQHPQQPHPQQQQQYEQQQQQYGWDPSQGAGGPYGSQPGEQYGQQPVDPYSGGRPDYYGTPDAYPPPQPQHMRRQQEEQQHSQQQVPQQSQQVPQQSQQGYEQQHAPQPDEWHSEPGPEKLSLFDDAPDDPAASTAVDDDADEAREERPRGRDRRGKKAQKGKKNKRRSGTACLVVAVVLLGVVGGGGYVAYDYWQSHFGAAPDYDGEGTGQIQVEIPKSASLTEMGAVLQKAGVVKSVGAFTEAAGANPKGKAIQPGIYILRKEMSGAAAVTMMTDPKTLNALTLGEGMKSFEIYAAIDKKLGLKAGTTKDVATSQVKNLGLPAWAGSNPDIKDPLEGFLFPSQYSAAKGTKPEDILKQMVARAKENYTQQDVEGKAKELGLKSPLQVVTLASLVQVEGKYKHDFDKISRVVYNRLKPDNKETYGLLDFDSTVNYARKQSTLDVGAVSDLRKFNDPYNTYKIKGLPPGPISNPGLEALKSALQPAPGPWYYFVSVSENETLFAVTNEEHNKNRQKYQQGSKKAGQ